MALVLADRVRETTTTIGTGSVTLAGALTGFQTFSAAVGDGNTTYYVIAGQGTSEWEVGVGTYASAGNTLARTTVLASSNAGSLVNFSAGTKDVWVDYAAGKAVTTDTLAYPPAIGGTTPAAGTFTTLTATGQTSLGGAAGSEGLRVTTVASSNIWLQASGGVSGSTRTKFGQEGSGSAAGFDIYARNGAAISFSTNGAATAEQFRVANTASAVNYVQVTGAATGAAPVMSAQGSDASITLTLQAKGASGLIFQTRGGGTARNALTLGDGGAASVNYLSIASNLATLSPSISSLGTDTDIDLTLTPKAAGTVRTSGTGVRLVGSTSGYVGLKGAAVAGSTTYTLPAADGTNGQVLATNGSATLSWATASGGGALAKQTDVFTLADNATYTAPANTQWVKVTCVGSGGGAVGSTGRRCTGGGGGGVAIKWLAMTAGQTLTYTLLGGGAATVSSGSLTITTITGGAGGAGTTTVYANSSTSGPAGGTASGGDINITGGSGGTSYGSSTTVATNFSGAGGDSPGFGSGGSALGSTAANGSAGTGYGGGGGGSHGTNNNASGAQGVIIFEAY